MQKTQIKVKFKKLIPEANAPQYATKGSGAFDIVATSVTRIARNVREYSTGLAFEIPEGYGMFILSRSGQGFKHQVRLANCVGLIDSDYRGELKVQVIADFTGSADLIGSTDLDNTKGFKVGDKIAQAVILPLPETLFEESEELSETERGTGGFGSTDKGTA